MPIGVKAGRNRAENVAVAPSKSHPVAVVCWSDLSRTLDKPR